MFPRFRDIFFTQSPCESPVRQDSVATLQRLWRLRALVAEHVPRAWGRSE